MNGINDIRYLRRQEIDILKWDRCIEDAPNGLIYGRSFYLDHMTGGQWDALVLNDYEAIMPLTWRKKWGIRYLYQPPYTQQLGVFSAAPQRSAAPQPPADLIEKFLIVAGRHFRFAEIFLNHQNPHPSLTPHTNFILDLTAPYKDLAAQYKKGLTASLSVAERSSLQIISDLDLSLALKMNKEMVKDRTPHVRESSYRQFRDLCFFWGGRGQLLLRAVTKRKGSTAATPHTTGPPRVATGPPHDPLAVDQPHDPLAVDQPHDPLAVDPPRDPLAIVLFLRDKDRIYLLQATTSPAGRDIGANHFLLDHVIREFAGQSMTLDFEGSDLPGVAHFYKSFGAQDQPYFFYRYNRLPWPWRLFK
jgi:hypothetical protein